MLLAGISQGTFPYAIAKTGMEAFTKVLAKEEGAYGIRVNAIAPGIVKIDIGGRRVHAPGGSPRIVLKPIYLDHTGQNRKEPSISSHKRKWTLSPSHLISWGSPWIGVL